MTVEQVPATATYDLRRRVLRNGTPSQELTYAQDEQPGTRHLAVMADDRIVAVSTWAPEPWPGTPGEHDESGEPGDSGDPSDVGNGAAVRLRGMAVEPGLQGTGAGALLVRAGVDDAWANGATLVWASARDSALGFYERLGFTVVGDVFVDAATGLPHHLIVLSRSRSAG